MKLTVLISLILVVTNSVMAQPWFVKHPDLGTSFDYIYDIILASDGGYIFTGTVGGQNQDYLLTTKLIIGKIDNNGDTLWTKRYGELTDRNIGYAITGTSDGGYVVAGVKANKAAWLLRFKANGDTLWTKEFAVGEFHDVIITSDGGIAAAGIERSNIGNVQVQFVITDAEGNTRHGNIYGGIYYEEMRALIELPSGDFVLGGSTNGQGAGNFDVYVMKFDTAAVALWDTTYGSTTSDRAYDMIFDSNGDLVFAGSTNRNSDLEHLMLKIDTLGNLIWEKTYSSSVTNTLYDLLESQRGGYIGIGSYYDNGSGSGGFGLRPMMLRTDTAGTELWLREYNDVGFFETFAFAGLEVDNNDIYILGSGYNATFIRTDGKGTFTSAKNYSDEFPITIFPNPSNGDVILQTTPGEYSFNLYNMQGQLLRNWHETVMGNSTINLSNYPAGEYILNIINVRKSKSVRVIKR